MTPRVNPQELAYDWVKIWAAGGRIFQRKVAGVAVWDGSIIVQRSDGKFLYLVADETSRGIGLNLGEDAWSFGRFVPPIQKVETFPKELPLHALLGPLEKHVHVREGSIAVETRVGNILISRDPHQPEALTLDFQRADVGPA